MQREENIRMHTVSKIDMAWHRTTSTGFVRESVGTQAVLV
jgi:hypothetical protein